MRTRNTIYYFLFLVAITGVFASVAQNDYGLQLVAWAFYGYSATLLGELILRYRKLSVMGIVETTSLIVLFSLMAFRASFIHFRYVEWIVCVVTGVLMVLYLVSGMSKYKSLKNTNLFLGRTTGLFYLSLGMSLLTIFLRVVQTGYSMMSGVVAGGFLGIVLLAGILRRKQMLHGNETSLFAYISGFRDHSFLLMAGFLSIGLYLTADLTGIMPPLYTRAVPKAYIELVNRAESGEERAVNGRYEHDVYREAMEKFLERHGAVVE